ncbi:MAG: hypothetical protein PHH11_07690 [Methylomonas sp.]|nr:hypothetical protein [Methylomonas sp.]
MQIISIPTEQTTAATDLAVALLALFFAFRVWRLSKYDDKKANIWVTVFLLLSIAGVLGTIAHGLALDDKIRNLLWRPLYLSLGLLVSYFVVATVYDVWGESITSRVVRPMIFLGVAFFVAAIAWPDDFIIFIVYEAAAMLFALIGYSWLTIRRLLNGAGLILWGILLSIVAAAVQAGKLIAFQFIWQFDHNGTFHLIQIVALAFLFMGLQISLIRKHKRS